MKLLFRIKHKKNTKKFCSGFFFFQKNAHNCNYRISNFIENIVNNTKFDQSKSLAVPQMKKQCNKINISISNYYKSTFFSKNVTKFKLKNQICFEKLGHQQYISKLETLKLINLLIWMKNEAKPFKLDMILLVCCFSLLVCVLNL